jgi:competence protein ComEC
MFRRMLPFLFTLVLVATPRAVDAADRPLVITFLDVGQGDCSLLQLPDGNDVLIDGGIPEMGGTVVKALKQRGVKALDLVIMTHPHADHVGGLHAVFQAFPVRLVLDSGMIAGSRAYRDVLTDISNRGFALKLAEVGMTKHYGPVGLEVLAPVKPFLKGTRSDINNASIVTRWTYGEVALLETGDAEQETIDLLLKRQANLQAQILKVPHHGSRYTSSASFLAAVHPEIAVISAGLHNDYHHPHKAALDRLARSGAKVYVTATEGTITVTTDGHRIDVQTEKPESAPVPGDGAGASHHHHRKKEHRS